MYTNAVKYLSAISLNERIKFLKLLLRWQGSVWKLLWIDFIWFSLFYAAIAILYRMYLINDPNKKEAFESIVIYLNKVAAIVPLSFLLGFFVSTVLGRWWKIVSSVPWMTKPAFTCQALINEDSEPLCKDIRLTIVRYMNLAWILSVMYLSSKVKQRFIIKSSTNKTNSCSKDSKNLNPNSKIINARKKLERINSDEIVKKTFGKLIMEDEIKVFENVEHVSNRPSFITPLMWTTKLIEKAHKEGYIKSQSICFNLFCMVQDFKSNLCELAVHNEFNVPLVYTQVIIIVVYTFLISELLSEQIISNQNLLIDSYLPIFGIFKFIIYMGWFKMGLSFINPFGSDPSDLPLDEILDYNLEISSTVASGEEYYYPEYLSKIFCDSEESPWKQLENFRKFVPETINVKKKEKCCSETYVDGHMFATHDEPDD